MPVTECADREELAVAYGVYLEDGERLVRVVGGTHGAVWVEDCLSLKWLRTSADELARDGFVVVVPAG